MRRTLLLISLAAYFSCGSIAQVYTGKAANAFVDGSQKVKINPETNTIEFIDFQSNALKVGASDTEILSQALGVVGNYEFRNSYEFEDDKGWKHIRKQLYYNGILVEGMVYMTHFENNVLKCANGKIIKGEFGPGKSAIFKDEAIKRAIALFDSKQFVWDQDQNRYPTAELIYVPINNELKLCYKIDIYSLQPLSREYVYISAQTGEVLKRISRIHDTDEIGTAVTRYNGNVEITTNSDGGAYILQESGRGNGITTFNLNNGTNYYSASHFSDDDNVWDVVNDQAAYDAHFGSEKTYDYYFSKFGRNSIDDNGFAINSYVHYGNNYSNAFWDGERMTYGDGDGVSQMPYTSLDIVGHEITHGLTTFTANLEYSYESGALNESFSDIFGIAIDFYANASAANYLMGEQTRTNGTPIRSMEDPNSFGYPDTYQGNYWSTGSYDNGGVHINSSVQNYWFYLLCEGGNGVNDSGNNYRVNAIGMEAAEAIAYRTLTVYLTQYSNFDEARFYSIQSALDLYGNCSAEVIEVTNAWHAVGVGDQFNDAVVANFEAAQTYSCSVPVSISFTNYSSNATTFKWFVNDELVSTEAQPTLDFSTVGQQDVMLIASGSVGCGGIDTLSLDSYITISNTGSPTEPATTPGSVYGGQGGIYSVVFAEINKQSEGATEGYIDNSCQSRGAVIEGKRYPVTIITGSGYLEDVYVWIDLNNDGIFSDRNELIYQSVNKMIHHSDITIPKALVLDAPLRMRIGSERSGYAPLSDGSNNSYYGQYEDYSLIIRENTEAPETYFTISDSIASVNSSISFFDKTLNLPEAWSWTFDGGTPASSSLQNPQVIYSSEGTFNVELTATNGNGSSTYTRQVYVVNEFTMGTDVESTVNNGKIYDSGGSTGSYQNSENNQFLISPNCGKIIELSINHFATESCCDYLRVYDGASNSAILLGEYRGDLQPFIVSATSGNMLLEFHSDGSVTSSGFEATWTTQEYGDGNSVVAAFTPPGQTIPFNTPWSFLDESSYDPFSWEWYFGDGAVSFDQNPTHTYTTAGDYDVWLKAENCTSRDSMMHQITVDTEPIISVSNDTIRFNLISGDTIHTHIPVLNGDGGALLYHGELLAAYKKEGVKYSGKHLSAAILSGEYMQTGNFMYTDVPEYDNNEECQVLNWVNKEYQLTDDYTGLNVCFGGDYTYYADLINELVAQGANWSGLDYGNVAASLDTMNVLILDDASYNFPSFTEEIKAWVSNGGLLIIGGDGMSGNDDKLNDYNSLVETSGIVFNTQNSLEGNAVVIDHVVTTGISQFMIGGASLASLSISSTAIPVLFDSQNRCHAAVSERGQGKILAVADEVFMELNLAGHRQLFFNTLDWGGNASSGKWIVVDSNARRIEASLEDSVKYEINTSGLIEGVYLADIMVASNDPGNGNITVPVRVDLTGIEEISVSADTIWFPKVFVNYSDSTELIIRNTGTRDLELINVVSSHNDFPVDFAPATVAPHEGVVVKVKFNPVQNLFYDETLTLLSSDPDTPELTIALRGNAVRPPVITTLDEISQSLFTDEKAQVNLAIGNITGGSALAIDSVFIETFTSSLGAVADSNYVDMSGHRILFTDHYTDQMVYKLLGYGATVHKNELDTLNVDYDVIYITRNTYFRTGYADFFKRWVKAGNALFIEAEYSSSELNEITSAMGVDLVNSYASSGVTTDITSHPITHRIQDHTMLGSSCLLQVSGEAQSLVRDHGGNTLVAAAKYGEGRLVVCNTQMSNRFNYNHSYLLGLNAFRWLANKNSWLWASHYAQDSIQAGTSHSMQLMFDAQGLMEGVYKANIRLTSNDPVTPEVMVHAQLDVTGIPKSEFVRDTLDFALVYSGQSATDSVILYNSGTSDLVISDLYTVNSDYSVSTTGFTLLPREHRVILLGYEPTSVDEDTGYLIVETNTTSGRDTVVLGGYCQNPPVLSVTPAQIDLLLRTGDTATERITIDNSAGGSKLFYDITVEYPGSTFQLTPSGQRELSAVLDSLNLNYSNITSLIPNSYNFSNGVSGNSINDGGNDMYDGGNFLNTNRSSSIPYSDNVVRNTSEFGSNSAYFTRKYDGLFVMVADVNDITEFYISGGLGADGSGSVDGAELSVTKNGKTFKGFVKRVYNAGDPSVNHLVIIEEDPDLHHTYSSNTNLDDHHVNGLHNVKRIYYLLYAGQSGHYIDDEATLEIMNAFLNGTESNGQWVEPQSYTGMVAAGQSVDVDVFVNASGMAEGMYQARLNVKGNDPVNSLVPTSINLEVNNNLPPYLANPIGNKVIYSTYNDVINLNDVFTDPDNDLLYYHLSSSDNDVVFPVLDNGSELRLTPIANGMGTITIETTDNNWDPITYSFDVMVRYNQAPVVDDVLSNREYDAADSEEMTNLNHYFSDPDGDVLTFTVNESVSNVVSVNQGGNLMILSPVKNGSVILTVTASDAKGASVSQSFVVKVTGIVTSIDEQLFEGINIYPNPVATKLFVDYDGSRRIQKVQLLNMIGGIEPAPYEDQGGQLQIEMSHLSSGVYFLIIHTEKGSVTHKVLKQ